MVLLMQIFAQFLEEMLGSICGTSDATKIHTQVPTPSNKSTILGMDTIYLS